VCLDDGLLVQVSNLNATARSATARSMEAIFGG
jgi:hypothetical protein